VLVSAEFILTKIRSLSCGSLLWGKKIKVVLCVEVPSGKIIWENREPRYYQKYGNDKLVFFYSSLWEDGYERGDNYQLAELDVRTGAFQMYKFPGYNTSTYVTMHIPPSSATVGIKRQPAGKEHTGCMIQRSYIEG